MIFQIKAGFSAGIKTKAEPCRHPKRTPYLAAKCFGTHPQFKRQMVFSLGFTTTCSKQPSVMMWGSDKHGDWFMSDVWHFYPTCSHRWHHRSQYSVKAESLLPFCTSAPGRTLMGSFPLSFLTWTPQHISAAFCSAANVPTRNHQSITTAG